MKLIKQNDSAGGLIFKQNQNGKAMKQNYSFGRAFKFSGSIRASSDFNHLMTNGFSFLVWGRNWPMADNFTYYITLIFDNAIRLTFSPRGTTDNLTFRLLGDPTIGDINITSGMVRRHENTSFLLGVVNNKITYNGEFYNILGVPEGYFVGKTLTKIIFPNSSYSSGLINDIVIYDRHIADAEVNYFFNNKLGNEELNNVGLIAKYKNDSASIVNNSVVIEDYKGAHNIELINLPSGTLQEQLDYANANLFEPW